VYMPFVLEAAVAGSVGSLIAIIGLGVAKIFLIDGALKSLFTSGIIPNIQWSSIALVSPILVLTAVVMAAVAAVVTLRFYVKL
jgi:cell division transport system permease protein